MTPRKILKVINVYEKDLEHFTKHKGKFSHSKTSPKKYEAIGHCRQMLKEMKVFVKEKRIGKAFRWLGFVQACLWCHGIYSLNELKNHNRP